MLLNSFVVYHFLFVALKWLPIVCNYKLCLTAIVTVQLENNYTPNSIKCTGYVIYIIILVVTKSIVKLGR